jgi:hypothetical protein
MVDMNGGPFVLLKLTRRTGGEIDAEYVISIPLYIAWEIMEVVHTAGIERAVRFASFALTVARAGHTEAPTPTEEEMFKLGGTISFLARMFEPYSDKIEERVLAFTYQFLRHTDMDRKMAAEFAATKLKKGPADDAWIEAWRKRVDRWALSHNLPQVGKRRKRSTRLEGVEMNHV